MPFIFSKLSWIEFWWEDDWLAAEPNSSFISCSITTGKSLLSPILKPRSKFSEDSSCLGMSISILDNTSIFSKSFYFFFFISKRIKVNFNYEYI